MNRIVKKIMIKPAAYFILVLITCFGCNADRQEKDDADNLAEFEETKWKIKDGMDYPHREAMLEDLLTNQGLRQMDRSEILNLLGEPDRVDTNHLFYRIEQQRIGLFPLHTKTMVIKLVEENQVDWVKIHE